MMEPDTEGGRRASGGFYCQQSVDIDDHRRQLEMQCPFNQSIAQQRQQTSASPSHGLLMSNIVGPLPPRHTSRMSFRQHSEDIAILQLEGRRPRMQQEDSRVNLSSRYPKRLCTLELCGADVRVRHLQEGPLFDLQSGYRQPGRIAYNMQPQGDGQARREWGFFESGPFIAGQVYCREGQTESSESTDQVRYSVEETNQFPGQFQPVEHMDTQSLPRQPTLNRSYCSRGEALNPGGIFDRNFIIWPIENFSVLLRDAVNGRINSLEGPPICTGRYGYKLRICIFPTGIDGGDRRHAGLFIGLMKGEYDNILKWPFTAIISLTMLDQSNGEDPHHISGTFVTDKNQRAFEKPDTAVQHDILYGYAEFAPIDMICNPRYSRDDTVMIKIEIHPYSIR